MRTEGAEVRGKLCTDRKPKDQSWTEVTHQQAPSGLEIRPSPISNTLLANRTTTTSWYLFGRKDLVSVIFSIPLSENHLGRLWGMLQECGFSPQLSRHCWSQGALCRLFLRQIVNPQEMLILFSDRNWPNQTKTLKNNSFVSFQFFSVPAYSEFHYRMVFPFQRWLKV